MEVPQTTRSTAHTKVSRSIGHLHLRELTTSRLRVVWTALDGTETVVAETEEGYRVLETT
jgi:hypothetical protein